MSVEHLCARTFLQQLSDASVDLVISSPPYGIGKDYEHRKSLDEYTSWAEDMVSRLARVVRAGGSVCWQVGNYVCDGNSFPLDVIYLPIFWRHGFSLKNRIVWTFGHGMHATKRLSGRYETCLWLVKRDAAGGDVPPTFNLDDVRTPSKEPGKRAYKGPRRGSLSGHPLGKNPSDVWQLMRTEFDAGHWDFPNVKSNHVEKCTDVAHPCQFPIELAERCVLAFSNENDLVVDPFCGLCATGVAALVHRRQFRGCDAHQPYVVAARERLARSGSDPNFVFRHIGTPVQEADPNTTQTRRYPAQWLPALTHAAKKRRLVQTANQRLAQEMSPPP